MSLHKVLSGFFKVNNIIQQPTSGFLRLPIFIMPRKSFFITEVLLLFLLFTSCAPNAQQTEPGKEISGSLLKADFNIFRKTIEEAHPGIYWYASKKDMDAYFDSVYASIDKSINDIDFYKLMMNVAAHLRCVHTSISLSRERERAAASHLELLPFDVIIVNNKAYISESFDSSLPIEFEIQNINDLPVGQIVQKMLEIIPTDGYNTTNKYQLLNRGLFRRAYALLMPSSDTFNIDGIDTGRHSRRVKVAAIAPDFNRPPTPAENPISWQLRDHDYTAILNLRSFELNAGEFSRRIDSFFTQVHNRKISRLIIDLRNNGGGNNVNVSELYSYCADSPFFHLRRTEASRQPLSYRNYVINISEYDNLRARLANDSSYEIVQYPGRRLREPISVNHFDGKLIVLVNGATLSAASELAALVRGNKRGTVIGEETGGCYYGSTGGSYLTLLLPNSRLRARIPAIRIFTAVPEDFKQQPHGRGVLPDFPVSYSIKDLLTGRDKVMEMAATLPVSRSSSSTRLNLPK